MGFDTSCWKLAKSFLEDGPRCLSEDINELAQSLQDVCEAHCRMIEDQEREAKEKFDRQQLSQVLAAIDRLTAAVQEQIRRMPPAPPAMFSGPDGNYIRGGGGGGGSGVYGDAAPQRDR
jgi:ElaB/YqjD/DUF883 family membrane-anchored ribosome-binding protein